MNLDSTKMTFSTYFPKEDLEILKIIFALCIVKIIFINFSLILLLATLVQFPNSVPVIVNLDLTLNFVTLIGRPQCNGRFCWQASLLHLRPSFSSTRMITRTIYVQDLSSGTVLMITYLSVKSLIFNVKKIVQFHLFFMV